MPVRLKLLRALGQVRQIRIRQADEALTQQSLGQVDVPFRQGLPDMPRAGMQHDPDRTFRVEAQFNEMIAAA